MNRQVNNLLNNNNSEMLGDMVMAMMGVDRIAYIRRGDQRQFTVFAADGTPIADFDSHQEAVESIRLSDLTPVQLH